MVPLRAEEFFAVWGQVSVELMPIGKEVELASITLSSRSDVIDVAFSTTPTMQKLGKPRGDHFDEAAGAP